jgi:hypothetical protein
MNWTGLGVVFPREAWATIKQRQDFGKPGVYILIGYVSEKDDLPTLYIGQGDVVRARLESHVQNKDFWSKAVVFVSSIGSGGLNRAHATWLEHALIQRALGAKQSHLENGTEPQEPALSEAEKADMRAFLREMLQILPLVGLNAFEMPKPVAEPMANSSDAARSKEISGELDDRRTSSKRWIRRSISWPKRLVGHPNLGRHDPKNQIHRGVSKPSCIGNYSRRSRRAHRTSR